MKRILKIFLCALALTGMMTISAFAADASISNVPEDVTITPYSADGVQIELSESGMYEDPAYYSLNYTSNLITEGGQYVVLMVEADLSGDTPVYTITEDSLIYINQTESQEGSVIFDKVYPNRLTDSVILLSGEAFDTNPKVVGTVNVMEDGTLGDVTNDGRVNSMDAQQVLRYSANLTYFDSAQMKRAEVSGDGKVNSSDAQLILRFAANLIDKFPADK